jgi:integrase
VVVRPAKRDRALIAFGFAGAFRRAELVALEVENLVEMPDGFRFVIRRSKDHQEGQGTGERHSAVTDCGPSGSVQA